MHNLLAWSLEGLALFIGLTVYGAMWHGAQLQGKHGWVVALAWMVALLVLINGLHQLHDLLGLHWDN